MANLRRSKDNNNKDTVIGRFKVDGPCKKHPKHVQSPGVCSLCLRDKLVQAQSQLLLAAASSSSATADRDQYSSCESSSLSSYCSSSDEVSSCASPMHHNGSSSVSIFLFAKHGGGLVKSKSMAVVPRRRKIDSESGDRNDNKKSGYKKNGFWFKLLHPKKSKRIIMEDNKGTTKLVRAGSLRETVTVAT